MHKTIWKYPVSLFEDTKIILPVTANYLHFGEQDGQLCVWICVPQDCGPTETQLVTLRVFGTGHKIDLKDRILGSVIADSYVWHLIQISEEGVRLI